MLKILRSLQAEHVLEIEPGIDGVQLHQAAREEPSADQERERRGQLTDDEHALGAAPATRAGRASAAGRHRADRIGHEREPRRPREQHRHRCRDDQREHQHARVEGDLAGAAREARRVGNQQVEPRHGEPEAQHAAQCRQDEILGQQLPPQHLGRRAERRADAHLTLALHQPRQREVPDVGAGDDEDHNRRDQQDDQRRLRLRRQLVLPRRDQNVEAARLGIRLRVVLMERRGNLSQLRLRVRGGGAGRQARVHRGHPMRPLVLHRRAHVVIVGRVVRVEVLRALRRVMRAGLEDADDLRLLDRQVQRLSEHRGIRSEHALPVRVSEDDDGRRAFGFVGRHQHPSEQRLRAEHRQKIGGDEAAGRAMRLAAPQDVERPVAELDELIDRLRGGSKLGHLRKRERRILDARVHLRLAQVHDAVGFRIRQRTQQHAVDDAEDRRVRADAEAERQDERQREPRDADQVSQRDAKIVDHGQASKRDSLTARGQQSCLNQARVTH